MTASYSGAPSWSVVTSSAALPAWASPQALDEVSGLRGERVDGLTGVWVGEHKLAAIGIRARRWVTYHGLALNVVTDLRPFGDIVPCGIVGRAVGSVRSMLGGSNW